MIESNRVLPKILLTTEEAGWSLGVSKRSIERLVANGDLIAREGANDNTRIHIDDLRAYADSRKVKNAKGSSAPSPRRVASDEL